MKSPAGSRNRRVSIQRRVSGQDEIGQPVETWEEVARPWASIRHASGVETIKSGADASVVRASIRILYRHGIDAGMRVVFGAAIYDIKAVLPDEQDRNGIDLVCEAANAVS